MKEGIIQKRIKLRNRYDDELSVKTNLHLFNEDWQRLEKLIEVFKKKFLSVDSEKPIHKEYWDIFVNYFGE